MIMEFEQNKEYDEVKTQLRNLGYNHALSETSMALVRHVLDDLVHSNDQLKTAQFLLEMENDQSSKDGSRSEKAQLVRECNMIHQKYYRLKESSESEIKKKKHDVEELTAENENLKTINAQLNDKINELRFDLDKLSKKMAKCFSKKVQMRENIIHLASPEKLTNYELENTNMSNAEEVSQEHLQDRVDTNNNSEEANMLNQILKERAIRAEKLIDDCRHRIESKDAELNRLQHLLADLGAAGNKNDAGQNTLDSSMQKEMHRLTSENSVLKKTIHHLEEDLHEKTTSERLLQLRYESMEVRLNNLNQVTESLTMEKENALKMLKNARQELSRLREAHLQGFLTEASNKNRSNVAGGTFDSGNNSNEELVRHLRRENELLLNRVNSLIVHEEKLSRENDRLRSRVDGDRSDRLKKVQLQLRSIEKDRDYWRDEAMQMQKAVQGNMRSANVGRASGPSYVRDLEQQKESLMRELNHMRRHIHLGREKNQDKAVDEILRSQNKSAIDRLRKENEALLQEREEMRNHMDRFERHLQEIQGNVKVLTQERDTYKKMYDEVNNELRRARSSTIHEEFKGNRMSLAAQALMKQLENEKEHYIADLLRMTTERDSLRERLRTLTDKSISEKAHLEQSIENLQGKLRRTENDATELAELLRSVRERAEMLDSEHNAMKQRLQDAIELAKTEQQENHTLQSSIQGLRKTNEKYDFDFREKESLISELREQISTLNDQIRTLNEHADVMERNLNKEREHISRLQQQISTAEGEKQKLNKRVNELEHVTTEKESRCHQSELKRQETESKLADSEHQMVEVERRLKTYLEELTILKHDRENMKSKINELKRTVIDGDRDHAKLLEDMNSLQTANKQLQFDLHEANERFELAKRRVESMEGEIKRLHESLNEKQDMEINLKDECMNYAKENDTFRSKEDHLNKQIITLQHDILSRDKEIEKERQLYQILKENCNKIEYSFKNTQSENDLLRNELATISVQAKQMIEEKEHVLSELTEIKRVVSELEMAKSSLAHELEQSFVERNCLSDQLKCMEDEMRNSKDHLTLEKHTVAKLEGELAAAHESEATQHAQLEGRVSELHNMRFRLDTTEAKYQEMSLQAQRMQALHGEMQKEVETLRTELIKARFQNEHLRKATEQSQCEHGCYHTPQCTNRMLCGVHDPDACEHGCQHSDECRQGRNTSHTNLHY